jgi:hypothetical protein
MLGKSSLGRLFSLFTPLFTTFFGICNRNGPDCLVGDTVYWYSNGGMP